LLDFNDSNITDVSLDTPVMRALSSIQGKINELNLIMGNQMNNSDTSEFNFNDSKILKESNANFAPEIQPKVAEIQELSQKRKTDDKLRPRKGKHKYPEDPNTERKPRPGMRKEIGLT
jgi:hypothetical protein